jgi:hypothetical protein
MKSGGLFLVSAFLYVMLALVLMLAANKNAGQAPGRNVPAIAFSLAAICLLFAYGSLRMRRGSLVQRRNFCIAGGISCGVMSALTGWGVGVVFAIPLLFAVLGVPDFWKSRQGQSAG